MATEIAKMPADRDKSRMERKGPRSALSHRAQFCRLLRFTLCGLHARSHRGKTFARSPNLCRRKTRVPHSGGDNSSRFASSSPAANLSLCRSVGLEPGCHLNTRIEGQQGNLPFLQRLVKIMI